MECGIAAGSVVTVHYDPLLMKVVAAGASRADALDRLASALDRTIIDGVRTTIPFLRRVLDHDAFRRGVTHTQMVEQGAFNA